MKSGKKINSLFHILYAMLLVCCGNKNSYQKFIWFYVEKRVSSMEHTLNTYELQT